MKKVAYLEVSFPEVLRVCCQTGGQKEHQKRTAVKFEMSLKKKVKEIMCWVWTEHTQI